MAGIERRARRCQPLATLPAVAAPGQRPRELVAHHPGSGSGSGSGSGPGPGSGRRLARGWSVSPYGYVRAKHTGIPRRSCGLHFAKLLVSTRLRARAFDREKKRERPEKGKTASAWRSFGRPMRLADGRSFTSPALSASGTGTQILCHPLGLRVVQRHQRAYVDGRLRAPASLPRACC